MKVFSENKKAYFDYNVLEKFEAGIVLTGHEVKSIKLGRMNLAGCYVVLKGGEFFIVGSIVPPYQPKNTPLNYNKERDRKLLLNKKEIQYLIGKSREKGLTLVPLRVYTTGARIKLEFAVTRGKKSIDKRESIKKRETDREIKRSLKI